ncbi:redoxin domain-containing protein [Terriglobus tenax]|uniref:redoxin domain-containing protein n=1 Tax=Terriglobus tenax TaxID=1111115 RepID=UPI0021E0FA68|nr:redoxin domain-containing protein [Terriglobus tenax]
MLMPFNKSVPLLQRIPAVPACRLGLVLLGLTTAAQLPMQAQVSASPLPINGTMPVFQLKGTDGKIHISSDWKTSPVLVVAFLSNHCTESQLNESRLNQLVQDYSGKDVSVLAIQSSNPKAFREEELAWSDVGESLDDMKERATFRKFKFPYLYDGDTGATAKAFGAKVAPSVYIFDGQRKLQYQGRIDDGVAGRPASKRDAAEAVDAILAGRPVPVATTEAKGCDLRLGSDKAIAAEQDPGPIEVSLASTDALSQLRKNPNGKLLMVNFYATWCGPCVAEFPDLMATNRMYRGRPFELVTVSSNTPEERPEVLDFLKKMHATTRNLLYGSDDVYAMQEAFDPNVGSAVPITVLLGPKGELLLDQKGEIDLLEIRRGILANLPDDKDHIGSQQYWATR